jgi:diadenosine tetraphosphate (Ap4A) HIT family hydrolase
MAFVLDPRLEADTHPVMELGLSSLRLMNDARYPWFILIPRVDGVVEILDLSELDQARLWGEIRQLARFLRGAVPGAKLNVAALGNVVPQLHVHLLARTPEDDAWPRPVWGVHPPIPRTQGEVDHWASQARSFLQGLSS